MPQIVSPSPAQEAVVAIIAARSSLLDFAIARGDEVADAADRLLTEMERGIRAGNEALVQDAGRRLFALLSREEPLPAS